MVQLDCNRQMFGGKLRAVKPAQKGGPVIYRVTDVGQLASTRMACPADQPRRRGFVPMAGKAFVVPYNASRPIVVDAPGRWSCAGVCGRRRSRSARPTCSDQRNPSNLWLCRLSRHWGLRRT